MIVPTKIRFALRALIRLSFAQPGKTVSVREISEKDDISDKYLEGLFASLRAAGLVQGTKGKNGGYVLGRSAEDISLLNIIEAFEPHIVISVDDDATDMPLWRELRDLMRARLESISLKDAAQKSIQALAVLNFEI